VIKFLHRQKFYLIFIILGICSSSAFADNNDSSGLGITSLMQAVINNDLRGVKFFSRPGRAVINQRNIGGATALHLASRIGNIEIAKALIESGSDINIQDNEGWTPLMRAVSFSNFNISQILLSNGARIDKVNDNKESAIIIATKSSCLKCLDGIFKTAFVNSFFSKSLLKNEISKSFVIAQSRNNQEIQGFLEGRLDHLNSLMRIDYKTKNLANISRKTPNYKSTKTIAKYSNNKSDTSKPLAKISLVKKEEKKTRVFSFKNQEVSKGQSSQTYAPKLSKPEASLYSKKKFKFTKPL